MELRLFASHHAGGSPLPHPARTPRFPTGRDVRPADLPGRGALSGGQRRAGAREDEGGEQGAPFRSRRHDAGIRPGPTGMGDTATELRRDPEPHELFAPAFREVRRSAPGAPPPVPLSVHGGTRATAAPPHGPARWAERAAHVPGMPLCDGRHLSSRSGRTAPHRRIADHLRGAPAPTAPARAVQR